MAENKEKPVGVESIEKEEPQPIELHATFYPTGAIGVNCVHAENEIVMLGLVDKLWLSVIEHHRTKGQKKPSLIQRVAGAFGGSR